MRYLFLLLAVCIGQVSLAQQGDKLITLDDLWKNNTFKIASVPGFNAMKDGLRFTKLEKKEKHQEINVYNLAKGDMLQTIFNSEEQKFNGEEIRISGYAFSEGETRLLLFTEHESVYRRSAKYIVYVYDIASKDLVRLSDDKVLHATFSPDAGKVAYVKDNNLYYKELATGKEVAVTIDGKWNHIINGNCDWVYE
ncbi:MAG: DPP IV N-terminal domain-containing protein, partial [Chitinophagaceae bacterium]|nr:DPP IV N-terminal domain-containing protein [Chitinophagaceae bacterium]